MNIANQDNSLDLLRIHLFPDDDEKTSYRKMCEFAGKDELVQETMEKERQAQVREDFRKEETPQPGAPPKVWDDPIPFGKHELPPFPVDALPYPFSDYSVAVAEATQTPVDMAGTAILTYLSVVDLGKHVVEPKPGWIEPLNLYSDIIARPSERKSRVSRIYGLSRKRL